MSRIPLRYLADVSGRVGWHGLSTADYLDEGAWLVTGTDIVAGRVAWPSCHRVAEERWQQDPRIQLAVGDVLVTKDGTVGKIAHVDRVPGLVTLNSGVFRIRPLGAIDGRFLFWVFQSQLFLDFMGFLSRGSTIDHLSQRDIVRFQVPVSGLNVQRNIAVFLDREAARPWRGNPPHRSIGRAGDAD